MRPYLDGDVARQIKSAELGKWLQRSGVYLFWPAVALIVWGELSPQAGALEFEVSDKVLHFTAYFGLAGMVCLALKADRRVLAATLGLAALGGVLEVLQGFTGRDPSIFDELANIAGAFSGAACGWLALRVLRPKVLAAPGAS